MQHFAFYNRGLGKFVIMKAAPNNVAVGLMWRLYSSCWVKMSEAVSKTGLSQSSKDFRLLKSPIIIAVESNFFSKPSWETDPAVKIA